MGHADLRRIGHNDNLPLSARDLFISDSLLQGPVFQKGYRRCAFQDGVGSFRVCIDCLHVEA